MTKEPCLSSKHYLLSLRNPIKYKNNVYRIEKFLIEANDDGIANAKASDIRKENIGSTILSVRAINHSQLALYKKQIKDYRKLRYNPSEY